jgi:hypothetical protein
MVAAGQRQLGRWWTGRWLAGDLAAALGLRDEWQLTGGDSEGVALGMGGDGWQRSGSGWVVAACSVGWAAVAGSGVRVGCVGCVLGRRLSGVFFWRKELLLSFFGTS